MLYLIEITASGKKHKFLVFEDDCMRAQNKAIKHMYDFLPDDFVFENISCKAVTDGIAYIDGDIFCYPYKEDKE